MSIRRLISILAVIIATAASGFVPHVYVYRSDHDFNAVEDNGYMSLMHIRNPDGSYSLALPTGDIVPLSVIDSCVVRMVDVPRLYLKVEKYPDATMLWDKELYLDATVEIYGCNYIGNLPATGVRVKGRGNSSWGFPKKPMRLKFDKKTEIEGLSKSKNYVLLANSTDASLMKNALMMWLANRIGLPYANHGMPCMVYFNGHPAGSYLLTEKVGISSGSVDINEDEGVLFELSTEFDEPYKFRSSYTGLPVMVKDPDFAELAENGGMSAEERLELWRADWNRAENAVFRNRGFEYFDIDTFVKYIFIFDLMGNNEIGWPKSVYVYKRKPGTEDKYMFGPAWDFDTCANRYIMEDDEIMEISPDTPLWLCSMFRQLCSYKEFQDAYSKLMKDFRENDFEEFIEFAEQYAAFIEPSAKLNGLLWPADIDLEWTYIPSTFDSATQAARLIEWLKYRQSSDALLPAAVSVSSIKF